MANRARDAAPPGGFTLLEVLIVVSVIALFGLIVGARIGGGFGVSIRGEGRVLAAELRQASQRAIATGRTQRWVLDLDNQAYRLEEQIEIKAIATDVRQALRDLMRPPAPTQNFVPVQTQQGGWRWLDDEEVLIDGVETREGFTDQGVVWIGFGPDGAADAALIALSDAHGNRIGLRVEAFTGSVRMLDAEQLDAEPPLDQVEAELEAGFDGASDAQLEEEREDAEAADVFE